VAYDPRAASALCSICPLLGKRVVPPQGPPDADFMLIGEAPGRYEEIQGSPFVGQSGMALNEILAEAGIKRSRCMISNGTLCRPETPTAPPLKRHDMPTFIAYIRSLNAAAKKLAKSSKSEYKPIASPIDCCAPRLWREIHFLDQSARRRGRVNGIVIVPLGNFALTTSTGRRGIMKFRGSVISLDRDLEAGTT